MGQKVNPNGIRLGINRTWSSRWYSKSEYSKLLHEDLNIKKFVEKKLKKASISKVNIERAAKKLRISIFSSRPGIIIGKKGADIEVGKKRLRILREMKDKTKYNLIINCCKKIYKLKKSKYPLHDSKKISYINWKNRKNQNIKFLRKKIQKVIDGLKLNKSFMDK